MRKRTNQQLQTDDHDGSNPADNLVNFTRMDTYTADIPKITSGND